MRLITITETLIILDITKTDSNHCINVHCTEKWKLSFCFFTDRKQHKVHKPDMITHDLDIITHTLNMIIESAEMSSQELISKIHCTLLANHKRDSEFNV